MLDSMPCHGAGQDVRCGTVLFPARTYRADRFHLGWARSLAGRSRPRASRSHLTGHERLLCQGPRYPLDLTMFLQQTLLAKCDEAPTKNRPKHGRSPNIHSANIHQNRSTDPHSLLLRVGCCGRLQGCSAGFRKGVAAGQSCSALIRAQYSDSSGYETSNG